jgi:hypothetical protein
VNTCRPAHCRLTGWTIIAGLRVGAVPGKGRNDAGAAVAFTNEVVALRRKVALQVRARPNGAVAADAEAGAISCDNRVSQSRSQTHSTSIAARCMLSIRRTAGAGRIAADSAGSKCHHSHATTATSAVSTWRAAENWGFSGNLLPPF